MWWQLSIRLRTRRRACGQMLLIWSLDESAVDGLGSTYVHVSRLCHESLRAFASIDPEPICFVYLLPCSVDVSEVQTHFDMCFLVSFRSGRN